MGIRRLLQLGWVSVGSATLIVLALGAGRSALTGAPQEGHQDQTKLLQAIRILEQTRSGAALLSRARRTLRKKEFLRYFEWGEVSRTDAVLTRHFDPETGEETRSRSITIFLRQEQPLRQLTLDIAHELTHAVSKPLWDPYDPRLGADHYVWSALEGAGGEIEALTVECQIAVELNQYAETDLDRCKRYLSPSDQQGRVARISREKIREDFYRVGEWLPLLKQRLSQERFPVLSGEPPRLLSSTGNSPYPVALLEEYDELTRIACRNTRRRLASLDGKGAASLGSAKNIGNELLAVRCSQSG